MRRSFVACLALISLIVSVTSYNVYAQEDRKLNISMVGSIFNSDPKFNPFAVCKPNEVKQLLLSMAEEPMPKEAVESGLSGCDKNIEDLLRIDLIREEDGLFYINFPLFTEEDQQKIMSVAKKYSRILADRILKKKEEIYSLLDKTGLDRVGNDKQAFIVVGCLFLDWGGLSLFAQNGYIVHMPVKPGGNRYVFTASEITEFSLKELYWGGHSQMRGGLLLLTFGDQHAETTRNAFPDLLWQGASVETSDAIKKEFDELIGHYFNSAADKIMDLLLLMEEEPQTHKQIAESSSIDERELKVILAFMEKLGYVEVVDDTYYLTVPVYGDKDIEVLMKIREIIFAEVLSWINSYYTTIKDELKDICAVRSRVDYKEVFNMLWHYFFGLTNKYLAREGFIYDTYSATEGKTGYLPAAFKLSVAGALRR